MYKLSGTEKIAPGVLRWTATSALPTLPNGKKKFDIRVCTETHKADILTQITEGAAAQDRTYFFVMGPMPKKEEKQEAKHVCIRVYVCVSVCVYMYGVSVCICTCVCACVCMCMCMQVYVHICLYVHVCNMCMCLYLTRMCNVY